MPRRPAQQMLAAHQPEGERNGKPQREADRGSKLLHRGGRGGPLRDQRAKQRRIVVTEANIYVLEGDFWGTTKSKGLIAKHAIGSVPIAFRGRALIVGEERIWLHPFAEGDAEEIASLSAG